MKQLISLPILFLILLVGCKKDKPDMLATLTTTTVTAITSSSAQSGGSITNNGGAPITRGGVCWATHSNPTVGDSITTDPATSGSFSSSLANLNANTTYYVRAYAINSAGTAYGQEVTFTTAKGLASLTTTIVSNIVPLKAQSGGTIISDGGYAVIARGISWSTSPHPTINDFISTDGTGTGSFTDSLTLLGSQTTYYVRAYATSSFGTAYGNEISFISSSADAVTDIDGNVYPYVQIGTQTWMTVNLKTSHYRNGDPINRASVDFGWDTDSSAVYDYPDGNPNNNALYGKYYNVSAILSGKGIAPAGWHVPTDAEWQTLEFYEGMTAADTSTDNLNFRGTIGAKFLPGGSSGLNLQLAGYGFGGYNSFGQYGVYASSTPDYGSGDGTQFPFFPLLWFRGFNVADPDPGPIYRQSNQYGMSVRCIKD